MRTQLYSHRDDHGRAHSGISRFCSLLCNSHARTSQSRSIPPLWRSHHLLGPLQAPDDVDNQFPGRKQPSPAQFNMSNNGCCNKSPVCICAVCTILLTVLIAAICIPLATKFMDTDPTIPPGQSGPIKIDKNLIGRMSLVDISQEGSEGETFSSSTWILLCAFGLTILFSCSGYAYHRKCHLPRRRLAREADRVQRERQELHSAFIERMMERENQRIPPV